MAKLKDVGKNHHHFHNHYPDLDTDSWPGRELLWAWLHPVTTVLILGAVLWEIAVTIWKITL